MKILNEELLTFEMTAVHDRAFQALSSELESRGYLGSHATLRDLVDTALVSAAQDVSPGYLIGLTKDKFTEVKNTFADQVCDHVKGIVCQNIVARLLGQHSQDPSVVEHLMGYRRMYPSKNIIEIKVQAAKEILSLNMIPEPAILSPMNTTLLTEVEGLAEAVLDQVRLGGTFGAEEISFPAEETGRRSSPGTKGP